MIKKKKIITIILKDKRQFLKSLLFNTSDAYFCHDNPLNFQWVAFTMKMNISSNFQFMIIIVLPERSSCDRCSIYGCGAIWQAKVTCVIGNSFHMASEDSCFPGITKSCTTGIIYWKIPRYATFIFFHLEKIRNTY